MLENNVSRIIFLLAAVIVAAIIINGIIQNFDQIKQTIIYLLKNRIIKM